jgi:hypothetical protein
MAFVMALSIVAKQTLAKKLKENTAEKIAIKADQPLSLNPA